MSRLRIIEAIKTVDTGRRRPKRLKFGQILQKVDVETYHRPIEMLVHETRIFIGTQFCVNEQIDARAMSELRDMSVKSIVDHIFGEARDELRSIYHALVMRGELDFSDPAAERIKVLLDRMEGLDVQDYQEPTGGDD